MSRRPTIQDLAAAAGVSVATVDRVLNRRHPVRPATAARVAAAAEAIGFHAAGLIRRGVSPARRPRTIGFLLQKRGDAFYRQLAADAEAAAAEAGCRAVVENVDELSPDTLVEGLDRLARRVEAIAVVSIDHPHVSAEIAALRARSIPTLAIVTDLSADARIGYVGRDNRREGRTAAWMIARTAGRTEGRIGIVVGSPRYLCQETAEISFRSWFREHAPSFRLSEPLVNLEDDRIAYEAVVAMTARSEDLAGLYVCGGGVEGVIRALRDEVPPGRLSVVCNDLRPSVRSALVDGVLTAVIATRTMEVMQRSVAILADACDAMPAQPVQCFVPFDLHIAETV